MATSAAIDRLVHHSVAIEFDVESFRAEKAKGSKRGSVLLCGPVRAGRRGEP